MFIAEIGINHNGSLEKAKELIKLIKDTGVNVIKFQKRTPELCVPIEQQGIMRSTPWGNMTYLEYRKYIEFNEQEYNEIDLYCKSIGVQWTSSVWDVESYNFLRQYDPPFIKIPSPCLTHYEMLQKIKTSNIPVILSTGMSTVDELDKAVAIFEKDYNLTLLHCTSSYPTKDNELDLYGILYLKERYPYCRIGYSGHEKGLMPTIIAKVLGAEVLERHVTLNKNMWGTDHKISLSIPELRELVSTLNNIPTWLGYKRMYVYPSEMEMRKKLRKYN